MPDNPDRLDVGSRVEQKLFDLLSGLPFLPSPRKYNLTISHEQKFIWYRVAKVGTRTIFSRLHQTNTPLEVESASWVSYPPRAYADYFKFGLVRNPWDRIVSCWMNKVVDSNFFRHSVEQHTKNQEFECFIDWVLELDIDNCDRHLRAQSALIDLNNCDYIGRLERFEDELDYIFGKIGVHPEKKTDANRNKHRKPYQQYYTTNTIEKVRKIYGRDIGIFGYDYEE